MNKRKRKRSDSDLWQKPLHRQKKIQKTTWQHKNATKNFKYTTIVDRLRTVSSGNDSHPTGVVKPVTRFVVFFFNFKWFDSVGYAFSDLLIRNKTVFNLFKTLPRATSFLTSEFCHQQRLIDDVTSNFIYVISVGIGGFVIGLGQISFFFYSNCNICNSKLIRFLIWIKPDWNCTSC